MEGTLIWISQSSNGATRTSEHEDLCDKITLTFCFNLLQYTERSSIKKLSRLYSDAYSPPFDDSTCKVSHDLLKSCKSILILHFKDGPECYGTLVVWVALVTSVSLLNHDWLEVGKQVLIISNCFRQKHCLNFTRWVQRVYAGAIMGGLLKL